MSYKNLGITFFRFVTNHAFDGLTDRGTQFMQRVENVNKHSFQAPVYQ